MGGTEKAARWRLVVGDLVRVNPGNGEEGWDARVTTAEKDGWCEIAFTMGSRTQYLPVPVSDLELIGETAPEPGSQAGLGWERVGEWRDNSGLYLVDVTADRTMIRTFYDYAMTDCAIQRFARAEQYDDTGDGRYRDRVSDRLELGEDLDQGSAQILYLDGKAYLADTAPGSPSAASIPGGLDPVTNPTAPRYL